MAVDRTGRQIILGCGNELTVIPVDSLLQNRSISSDALKTAQENIDGKFCVAVGPPGSKIDYLSISKHDCGKRLVASVFDSSSASLFLQFFDLQQLYSQGPNTKPYCKFRVPGLDHSGFTRVIDWHPEQCDSVLACVFSNGVFNLLRVSEPQGSVGNMRILVN